MRKSWLLVAVVALLTGACRVETNVLIDLNADQSGSLGFEFGMDEEFRQLISAQDGGFTMDDIVDGLSSEAEGATVSERTEGDMTYTVIQIPFTDPADFEKLIAQGAGEGGNIDITWGEDSVTVDALLEGGGQGALGGLGDLGDLGGASGDLGGDLDLGNISGFASSFFSGSVIVAMPGTVGENNADRVLSDGRLQWDLALDGGDVVVHAVSDLSGGSGFPLWALVLAILLAAALLFWLYSTQRKRRAVAAVAAAGSGSVDAPSAPPGWMEAAADDASPARNASAEGDASAEPEESDT